MTEKNNLYELIESINHTRLTGGELHSIYIDDIQTDSRLVGENDVFVALSGENSDGHNFVESVLQSGCGAVVVEEGKIQTNWLSSTKTPILSVKSTRQALADLASHLYCNPEKDIKLVGITGTNGKTTITYLLEKVLAEQGESVGVIGTVNYRYTDNTGLIISHPAPFTTPDSLTLKKMLREMVDAGVTIVLMEVSSHALIQQRLGNILFDCAAFTNLSHDHLDYHHSLSQYFEAKTYLFTQYLKKDAQTVITHPSSGDGLNEWALKIKVLLDEYAISHISCGKTPECEIRLVDKQVQIDRTEVILRTPAGQLSFSSPMVGSFNIDNIMTTLGITLMLGYDMKQAAQSLTDAPGAPGRLERIVAEPGEIGVSAFVDYAHTPDALLNVLQTLKSLPHNRLLCVFGCGGDRDAEKRPEMGKIAAELADIAIITDDNPRSEDSHSILEQIVDGVRQVKTVERSKDWLMTSTTDTGYVVIPDRREAIHCAVNNALADDIVVIAGKGHEKYQLTNGGKRFFDDSLEVREAMVSWDLESMAAALGVNPEGYQARFFLADVSTDSRSIQKGQIFVALHGENFNGHEYVSDAVQAGAAAIIVAESEKMNVTPDLPVFQVADTLKALGDLAAYRRRKIAPISSPVIVGITGSCGKTTVKEMTAAIFTQKWPDTTATPNNRVLKTAGNFNNLIGLPLSLLPLQLKHEAAVLEMGMNQPGEIARLTEIADPDISCIVNVHGAHLEGVGSLEGVARAKEELYAGTHQRGILVVNLDDEHVAAAAAKYSHKKLSYTMRQTVGDTADLTAADIHNLENGNIAFTLHIRNNTYPVKLKVPGRHNVENCLAAAAIAVAAGIQPEMIISGLESFEAADKRLQIVSATAGYSIINDTYNANPASMSAGLATLASMNGTPKIAVLGDMLELGEESLSAHEKLGSIAAQSGLAFLLVVGSFAEHIAQGAALAGMARESIRVFDNRDEIVDWIKNMEVQGGLGNDTWMLIKASRGMRLETIVEELI